MFCILIITSITSVLIMYPCFVQASALDRLSEKYNECFKDIPEQGYLMNGYVHKVMYK